MRSRKTITVCGVLVVATLVGSAVGSRTLILEWWYLRRLESADYDVQRAAVVRLGALRSTKALPGITAMLRDRLARTTTSAGEDLSWLLRPFVALGGPEAVVELLTELPLDARTDLAYRLSLKEMKSVPVLACLLRRKEPEIREIGLDALAEVLLEDDGVGELVLPCLTDSAAAVRTKAAEVLCYYGPETEEVVRGCLALLKDGNADVRHSALVSLGDSGFDAKSLVPAFISSLEDKNPDVRWIAIRDVSYYLGDGMFDFSDVDLRAETRSAISALKRTLSDADAEVRAMAAKTLLQLDEEGMRVLSRALSDENTRVRAAAATALASREDEKPHMVPILTKLLSSNDVEVLLETCEALSLMITEVTQAVPALVRLLSHENWKVRVAACETLASAGSEAAIAVPPLTELLGDKGADVRRGAAAALASIGPRANSAEKALTKRLEDTDVSVRVAAARAVWRVSERADLAVPELLRILEQDDTDVFYDTLDAILEVGQDAPAAVPVLKRMIDTTTEHSKRIWVARAYWELTRDTAAVLPVIRAVLSLEGVYNKTDAVQLAHQLGAEARPLVPALKRLLRDPEEGESAKWFAARALPEIEGGE